MITRDVSDKALADTLNKIAEQYDDACGCPRWLWDLYEEARKQEKAE